MCIGFLCIFFTAQGQRAYLGSWNILHLQYQWNQNWMVFGETQLRSLHFYDHFHYYEWKGGVQYKIKPGLDLTLGAGIYQTFKEGGNFMLPKNQDEFRLWPQLNMSIKYGKITIDHRYRAELRWTNQGFRSRFRYRMGCSLPFGTNGWRSKWKINLTNEIFFGLYEPYFERNRAAINLQYKITKSSSMLIGYLHQFDYRINDETGRDFLQIGYSFEIN